MSILISNPCIRCGKDRIASKETKLIINTVTTIRMIAVCPDKECQKIVEEQLAEKAAKKLALQNLRKPARKVA